MTAAVAGQQVPVATAPTRTAAWRRLLRSPAGLVGAVLVALVVLAAVTALLGMTPYDPIAQHPQARLQPPSAQYWFGTDQFGRDVFSRSLAGVGNSLRVAVVAVLLSALVGTTAGICAGFYGARVRGPVLAVTNVLFAFPPLLLALTLATTFTRNWLTIAIAIAIVYVPIFVRVSRGPVLSLRETDFIKAARVLGIPTWRILVRHLLPNLAAIVIVQVTLSLSWAVLTEAALSFLGLGSPPPAPSLGSMVFDAKILAGMAWWNLAAPGAVIVVFVVGLNLLGDGLRDALDPRNGRNA
ncbi:diguanylate cyclase [Micromonospora sp. S4605]|uniref:ABC transporter permease n=1 Tax=Micromonospora sp. S4605 TaxID=1420897 RepID=UPI000D6EEA6D|nr:ABC transporter permease [Micromonospora sp. S4605]PWU56102.1 diguanylate cyclase [Micromonospora sp. S4605]